jgi:hypothetical protein
LLLLAIYFRRQRIDFPLHFLQALKYFCFFNFPLQLTLNTLNDLVFPPILIFQLLNYPLFCLQLLLQPLYLLILLFFDRLDHTALHFIELSSQLIKILVQESGHRGEHAVYLLGHMGPQGSCELGHHRHNDPPDFLLVQCHL